MDQNGFTIDILVQPKRDRWAALRFFRKLLCAAGGAPRVIITDKNWIHLGSKEAGPKVAAIFSVVESCRRLGLPVREYLAATLPGLANRWIQSLHQLTPAAYAKNKAQ